MLPPATKLLASPSEAVQLSACLCLGNLAMNPACRDVIIKVLDHRSFKLRL
jgi:hypothetical protein